MTPPNRSSQGLACAALAVVTLAAGLLAVGVNASAATYCYTAYYYNSYESESGSFSGLIRWGPFAGGVCSAICAVVVIAFQACRAPTGWAAHHSPLGTAMCGIGLFWSVVTLVTFILGSFSDSFTKINNFQSWAPEYQAEFIFSCCIAPLAWAAALVLAVYDRANLRQATATAQVTATSMKIGGDVQLEVEPESLPKQAVLV